MVWARKKEAECALRAENERLSTAQARREERAARNRAEFIHELPSRRAGGSGSTAHDRRCDCGLMRSECGGCGGAYGFLNDQ